MRSALLLCFAVAVAAQLPPRLEVPGAAPVPVPPRLSQYRRPTSRAYHAQPQDLDVDPQPHPQPRPVVRVRRPTARARQVVQQQIRPQPQIQPKQDLVSLTPRPVSEDPDVEFDGPLPPQPTRDSRESNAILPSTPPPAPKVPPPSSPPPPSPSLPTPLPSSPFPQLVQQRPPQPQGAPGRLLGNRPLYLQPAVFRNARPPPQGGPALQGGFRPSGANDEDNVILSRPSTANPSANPRAYLPGTGPNAPSGAPPSASTPAPLLDLPLPPSPADEQPRPPFRPQALQAGPPAPLTAIPAAQLQLAQKLAAQQQQAVHQVQLSSASSPSPSSVEDEDDDEDNDTVVNPNRRQSLPLQLQPYKATPGTFIVTPSTLDLDDDLPGVFTPSVPRRPQPQQQVFRPSLPLDLDNNAFSPSPRPLPPQPQPIQAQVSVEVDNVVWAGARPRRPSPPPAPTPSPQPLPSSSPRRPVLFRPERVNQVSPSPPPNVHVHQLLREDDDYHPVARPSPPRPVRPQPSPQPRPAVQQPRPRPQGTAINNKYQRDRKPVAQVLRRYREDNPDGSITWGYENDDGSFKEETIGVDCMVRGKYGYVDPDGNRREYTYQSGIPCTPAPPGQQTQADDQEGGYVDYQNNMYVLPNGQSINLDEMVKNRKRKPVGKNKFLN